jgi:uncharacterized membrane protein YeaQ/YmgE (transglycosylase-associated protein family)
MGIIAWLVVSLIAGFLGSKIVNPTGEGSILHIVLAIVRQLSAVQSSSG